MISVFKTEQNMLWSYARLSNRYSGGSQFSTDRLHCHLQNSDRRILRWTFFHVCFIHLHLSSHCGETSHVQLATSVHICLGGNL